MPSATNTTRLRVWRSPCCAAFALLLIQAAVAAARKAAYDLPLYLLEVAVRFGEVRDGYGGPRGQGNPRPNGRVLVAEVQSARFLVTGGNANLAFAEQFGARGAAQLLAVQEQHSDGGRRVRERLRNGEETCFGLRLPEPGGSPMVTRLQAAHA
ncbi:DUF5597 domain-containing protein [Xanthomonas translucens]|nr:DUF5597 domain-containing protein [Xanthomonas translucens]MCT8269516.1 DUF5597 domain-containing protein [Xanthomonas translucens pv. undulosa]UJB16255.1 DUF5597 domain-containing protein [Xanthomonas translucens pv. undulosa]WLA10444.1 DUF5597 domain-containing protein [Xanthomonas translucens]WNJ32757.1 DUF5597 domain-containing protein [Xanthomonas translucens pv. undulosa]